MSSASVYAALVDACEAQVARLGEPPDDRWSRVATSFRLDPHRRLEANTAAVARLVDKDDVVIDVGGGAGRVGLPLALRCREVINVEPSAAMREQFEASAREAGITNAHAIPGSWPEAAANVVGDVVFVANVTYFVREIVPFIDGLRRAGRKRVIIEVWSVPPPNHAATLFQLLHGEPQARVPTHRELLPVLWDAGLLPDVQVLPDSFRGSRERPPTRDDAVQFAVERGSGERIPDAARAVEAHFDELFSVGPEGFVPRWVPPTREMLITWTETEAAFARPDKTL